MGAMGGIKRENTSTLRSFVLVEFALLLCLSVFNFELFANKLSPTIANRTCNASSSYAALQLLASANGTTSVLQPDNVTCACAPQGNKIMQEPKSESLVGKVVSKCVEYKQWFAEGRFWHKPGKFPLCSMDSCFNFSRCDNMDELLVYHYNLPTSPNRYFKGLNTSKWYTPDPDKACLFFVFQDSESPWRPHPRTLPYWNNGMNHVLITMGGLWVQRNPSEDTIGYAAVLGTSLFETTYRPGFDIGLPLPGRTTAQEFQRRKPLERKYFLTFKGTRYVGPREGNFRSHPSFRNMHNDEDVIVATSCRHESNNVARAKNPDLGAWCDEDQKVYNRYDYRDLLNSTFSLAPAGVSGSSYRFTEILGAGAIPVLIVDNHVRPLENIVQWPRCMLQFPTTEMHRVLPALRAMSEEEILERQKYCVWAYNEFMKDDETLLGSVMHSLKVRFFGAFPQLSAMPPQYKPMESER